MLQYREARIADIATLRRMAFIIWPPTYGHILSHKQSAYMLNMMYSEVSLQRQLKELKHKFVIAFEEEDPVGFASWSFIAERNIYRLHKIYVLPGKQGRGIGKGLIEYVIARIQPKGTARLELNVNRHNKAKDFYIRLGFRVVREEDIPIGEGYFMNDFVMEKIIAGFRRDTQSKI